MGALIHIDGELVGNTTNQFRRYTFPLPAAKGKAGRRQHTVRVTLDPRIDVMGRFSKIYLHKHLPLVVGGP